MRYLVYVVAVVVNMLWRLTFSHCIPVHGNEDGDGGGGGGGERGEGGETVSHTYTHTYTHKERMGRKREVRMTERSQLSN